MEKTIQTYKWLNELPNSFLQKLDFDEFYLTHSKLNFSVGKLEKDFDANIMIYIADKCGTHNPTKKQLCQSLKIKIVSNSIIERIKKIEMESEKLISIVLYEKPARFKI